MKYYFLSSLLLCCTLLLTYKAQGQNAPPIPGPNQPWTYSIGASSPHNPTDIYVFNDDNGSQPIPWNCARKWLLTEAVNQPVNFRLYVDGSWGYTRNNIEIIPINPAVPTINASVPAGTTYTHSFTDKGAYTIKFWHNDNITGQRVDDLFGYFAIITPLEKVWLEAPEICAENYPVNQDFHFKIKTYPDLKNIVLDIGKQFVKVGNTCSEMAPMAVGYNVTGAMDVYANYPKFNGGTITNPPYTASSVLWQCSDIIPSGYSRYAEDYIIKYNDLAPYLNASNMVSIEIDVTDGINPIHVSAPLIIKHTTGTIPAHFQNYIVYGHEEWAPTNNPAVVLNGGGTQSVLRIGELLKIAPGGVLTIKDMTVEMGPGANVIVESAVENVGYGAYLKLDNATITAYKDCNGNYKMWQGIQVFGDKDHSQTAYLFTNPYSFYQGTLEMVNNATLSYANFAVQTIDAKDWSYTKGGGIVMASNSHFINNRKSVAYAPYEWKNPYLPSHRIAYKSEFTNCEFKVTEELERPFLGFVSGWGIRGIVFKGCDFNNTHYQNTSDIYGVIGYDFGVNFRKASGTITNKFKNLNRGIDVENISGLKTVGEGAD